MDRNQILASAGEVINGDRQDDYGSAATNFSRIKEGWNVIARAALVSHGELTEGHVALMLDWLKTARLLNKIDHVDSWQDKIGYSALGAEVCPPTLRSRSEGHQ